MSSLFDGDSLQLALRLQAAVVTASPVSEKAQSLLSGQLSFHPDATLPACENLDVFLYNASFHDTCLHDAAANMKRV